MLTIELRHLGGTTKTVTVVEAITGRTSKCLVIRWDIAGEYCIDIQSGYMVIMKGGKVTKQLQWRANPIEVNEIWYRLKGTNLKGLNYE